jgi:phenylpropionate dioxygenase-like ring-hydroxylating dioxygenase large terminal subunit
MRPLVDHASEVKLLTRLFELRDAKTTSFAPATRRQSTHVYADRDHFDREVQRLFRQRPLIAGLSCDLPRTGDYFTVELGSTSALVVRAENGKVQAFLNACRHRGSRLAEGCGAANRVFRCPYHAWVYDIDGRLMGQPVAKDAFKEIDRERTGLIQLPATEASGLIFVGPTPTAGPIEVPALLGDLDEELAGHDFDSWTLVGQRDGAWQMNWKMPYETFLEAYHIFALHRDSLAKEVLATPMLSEFFGPHGRGLLTGRQAPKLQDRPTDEWTFKGNANLVYWLFPNTVLSMPMTGHAELWQFYPGPTPDRTRMTIRFYAPEAPDTEKKKAFWERMINFTMGVVEAEDFGQQEDIQRNVASGIYPERIFGRNEPALIHYHESLDRALGQSTEVCPDPIAQSS